MNPTHPTPVPGKKRRLIDTIPEPQDYVPVPIEWAWLLTPYILSFRLPPDQVISEKLYVDVEARGALPSSAASVIGMLTLARTQDRTKEMLDLLTRSPTTVLMLGEPGVGKTTWLRQFFSRPPVKATNPACFVDGRQTVPAVVDMPVKDYVRATIRKEVIALLQAQCDHLSMPCDLGSLPANALASGSLDLERSIASAAKACQSRGVTPWLILDNFDRRDRDLQDTVIDYAKNANQALHIRAIVPVRPYTLERRKLDDLLGVVLPPPSLDVLLRKRAEYAIRSTDAALLLEQLRAGAGAALTWTHGMVDDVQSLHTLYKNVGYGLVQSRVFCEFLSAVHANDLHSILQSLTELCSSGYFCRVMMERLRSGDTRNEYELITAYLCGQYSHHRARQQSGQNILNLFESHPARSQRFTGIRILQIAERYQGQGGLQVGQLVRTLGRYGFQDGAARSVTERLVRARLLAEVNRFADWDAEDFRLRDDDTVTLTPTGNYYLNVLIRETRYIAAMSHVTMLPPESIEQMARHTGSAIDNFNNICVLLEDVGRALEEQRAALAAQGLLADFFAEFDHQPGFFTHAVAECRERAEELRRHHVRIDGIQPRLDVLARMVQEIRDKKAAHR